MILRSLCIYLFLFLTMPIYGQPSAQLQDCADCPCLFQQAKEKVEAELYDHAIRLYNAAKVCDPSQAKKIDDQIIEIFNRIRAQKIAADQARREAERQRKVAKDAQRQAEAAQQQAESSSRANQNALRALQLNKENPAQALRLAEMNYHLYPKSETSIGIFRELLESWGGGKKNN